MNLGPLADIRCVLPRLPLEPAELEPLNGAAGRLMVVPATLDKLE